MGDPQFTVDPQIIECLNVANEALNQFEDPAWLVWAELARLMPTMKECVQWQVEECK